MANILGPGAQPAPQAPAAAPLTLGDLLSIIWRRRVWAISAAIVVAAAVVLGSFRMTPLFEAKASLAVDRGRQAVDFERDPDAARVEYSLLNTQRDFLLSNAVLEQALKHSELRSGPAYQGQGDPVIVLRKRLKITTSRDSWVIEAALRDEDAGRARAGLEEVLNSFLSKQSERQTDRSRGALVFLSKQVADERDRVKDARAQAQRFRSEHNVLGSDPDHNQYSDRLAALNLQRVDLDRQLAAKRSVIDQLTEAEAMQEPAKRLQALLRVQAISSHPVVVEQQKQLFDLLDRQITLGQKYGERHPRIIEIDQEIAAKRQHLGESMAMAKATIQAEYQQLESQMQDLSTRVAQQEIKLNAYRQDLISLEALEQETHSREKLFEQLLTRLGEEEVSSRLDTNRVLIVDPAKATLEPVNIKKTLFVAAAAFLGLAAGALTALLVENLDRRVRGAGSVQALTGLPMIGQIPHVANLQPLGKQGNPEEPHNLAEAYRAIRAALRLARRPGERTQVLAITSCSPGEGKSTVSTRLAITLASTGAKVLLIDADMRKPTLHHHVGETAERGLSFILAGETGIEPVATAFANVEFLGVGVRPPNPAELLHSPALGTTIERARSRYDYVIIDTPPLGLVSDAFAVAEHADRVILVVRDRYTSKNLVRQVMARMLPIENKMLGTVLNGERRESDGYYYYDYAYKYGYGREPGSDPVAKPA
ncbi:MAG: polysaccharide biosynthesis tyrosine autokinase [Planctomycetes bacterium]|nr:polysaccharide biosynthesis tyrosine autokinase [Planctomycetota bacterium]